jgi:hypothetical protein
MNNGKRSRTPPPVESPQFERIPVSELRQGRHGKHHDLMDKIAGEIGTLAEGEAMRIPLEDMDVPLANLRSAVTRKMLTRGVKIATFCDGDNLFLWKKTAGTARYERKQRRVKAQR